MSTWSEIPVLTFDDAFNGLESLARLQSLATDESVGPTASWHQSATTIHGRRSHRIPLPLSICLTGLDDQLQPCASPVVVRGRDISVDGISFLHGQPLPYRYAAVSIRTAAGIESSICRLTWCRYSREGHYISGGRFVRHIPASMIPPADWEMLEDE
ncbi:hypothetical protein GC176_27470 [bacterium]|nr:hypothetical protein [bacterium]